MKKRQSPNKNMHADVRDSGASVVYLYPFLVLPILYCLGALAPVYYTWGINTFSVFAIGPALVALFASLLVMLPKISDMVWRGFGIFARIYSRLSLRPHRVLSVAAVSAVLLFLFFWFRSRVLIYGDGYLMLEILSAKGFGAISGQGYLQVFSIVVARLVVSLLTGITGISAEQALALFNSLGGVVGWWALYAICTRLSTDAYRRTFLLLVALTSGAVILFFGHIENYTWPTSLGLWTVYFSLGYVQRRNGSLPVVTFAVLTVLSHAITLPFLIIALIALSTRERKDGRLPLGLSHRQGIWVVCTLIAAIACLLQLTGVLKKFGLPHVFVPVWPEAGNHYWLFSPMHVGDVLNLLFVIAPLGVTLSIFCLLSKQCRRLAFNAEEKVLGWLTLLTFLTVLWIDPELGAIRDWDLLSLVGFPFSLWMGYRFSRSVTFPVRPSRFIVPAVMAIGLSLGPSLYEKTHPDIAIARLDGFLWQSPHYQTDYDGAYRCLSWATTLNSCLSRGDLAEKYFHRRLSVDRNSSSAWFNLGQIYATTGMLDSSAYCFEEAVRHETNDYLYFVKLADVKQKQGKFDEALRYVTRAEDLHRDDVTVHTTKAIILYKLGRTGAALSEFRDAYLLAPGQFDQNYNLGSIFMAAGQYDSACIYLNRARDINPRATSLYEKLIIADLAQGLEREAEATLRQLRTLDPEAGNMNHYRELLMQSRTE